MLLSTWTLQRFPRYHKMRIDIQNDEIEIHKIYLIH